MRARLDNGLADVFRVRGALKLQADTRTLGAAVTLLDEDHIISAFDAGGSTRIITLPARVEGNDGTIRLIINLSTAAENFTINNASAVTLSTLGPGATALCIATGTVEAPATRAWNVTIIGGSDLALVTNLAVTGNITSTGNVALGDSSGDLLAFHGATQTSLRSGAAGIAVTFTSLVVNSGSTSNTIWGFSTATAASALVTLVNEIRSALVEVGLMKGS